MASEHVIRIRDLRPRVDAPEVYAAQCLCGWMSDEHAGRAGERLALRDGTRHVDAKRPPRDPSDRR